MAAWLSKYMMAQSQSLYLHIKAQPEDEDDATHIKFQIRSQRYHLALNYLSEISGNTTVYSSRYFGERISLECVVYSSIVCIIRLERS